MVQSQVHDGVGSAFVGRTFGAEARGAVSAAGSDRRRYIVDFAALAARLAFGEDAKEDVFTTLRGVGFAAEEAQDEGDGGAQGVASGFRVALPAVGAALERREHVQGLSGTATGREDSHVDCGGIGRELAFPDAGFGEGRAPLVAAFAHDTQDTMLRSGSMTALPSASLPIVAGADAGAPVYDENGVDLSLVRYSLSLTPTQRLKAVENFMNAMASVRPAPPLPSDSTK